MNDNTKCFIKLDKALYKEITYKELEELRKKDITYKDKKFIYIHKMLMEVTQEEYEDYYYEIEQNRYAKKVLRKLSAISLDELESEDDLDYMADKKSNVEKIAIEKNYIHLLNDALLLLTEDEYEIIKALFFQNNSLRKYASEQKIPRSTLYSKEKKILNKLKKLMKI